MVVFIALSGVSQINEEGLGEPGGGRGLLFHRRKRVQAFGVASCIIMVGT